MAREPAWLFSRRMVTLGSAGCALIASGGGVYAATNADGIGSALAIRQEVTFDAAPPRLFAALIESGEFAAFSGRPATIDPAAGGSFSLFGGIIFGRNVEVKPDERLVQAWSDRSWPQGQFSLARFVLRPLGAKTMIVFDHTGFPNEMDEAKSLAQGWHTHYWAPLSKYLAQTRR